MGSDQIKVSVIVAVYNASKHLRECLDSIAAQTLKEIEIICVNDGSTDHSLEILREFEEKDSRFIVIDKENGGAGSARNRGLEAARGEYLSFLDSDDFFEPDMLENAYEKAKAAKADIIVFGSDQYRDDLNEFKSVNWVIREKELPPYRPMNQRLFTDNVFKVFVGWAWDKLFRTDFIRDNGITFQEIRTSNDMRFVFLAIALAKTIEVDNSRPYAHQRRDDPSSLSNTREKSWHCFHDALNSLKDKLMEHGVYDELKQDYINYTLHASLWNLTTIKGEMREVLYNKLRDEWFEEFGITSKDQDYFYNQSEYTQYEKVMASSFRQWEAWNQTRKSAKKLMQSRPFKRFVK